MAFQIEVLAKLLRERIAARGLQAQEVARRAHMHPPALSRILSMRATPTLYNLQRILEVLGVTMGEFFTLYDAEVLRARRKKELIEANARIKRSA